jgi:uncharacterized protein YceK
VGQSVGKVSGLSTDLLRAGLEVIRLTVLGKRVSSASIPDRGLPMTLRPLTILLPTVLLSGCGTFADAFCGPLNDQVYYRGVTVDLKVIQNGGESTFMALDLPFSALADTALVPYQAYLHLTGQLPVRLKPDPNANEGIAATGSTAQPSEVK